MVSPFRKRLLAALPAVAVIAATAHLVAVAQDPIGGSLPDRVFQRDPFDLVTLKGGTKIEVLPFDERVLPNRRMPKNPPANKSIRLRILKEPDKKYAVLWKAVKSIQTFEMMILAEATSHLEQARNMPHNTAAEKAAKLKKFDDVFPYFAFLKRNYPNLPPPGMEQTYRRYLYFNGLAFRDQDQILRAFSLFEELFRRSKGRFSSTPGGPNEIVPAINSIVTILIDRFIKEKKYVDAREYISRMQTAYGGSLTSLDTAASRLSALAAVHRDAAKKLLQTNKLQEATVEVRKMLSIWPNVPGGNAVAIESARRFPELIVAVNELPLRRKMDDFANWAARRAGRLTERMLYEPVSPGSEGAVYRCPIGRFDSTDEREVMTQFTMRFSQQTAHTDRQPLNGFDLSRLLISRANPKSSDYDRSWAAAFESVRVNRVVGVDILFRRAHILPPAIMRLSLKPKDARDSFGPYIISQSKPQEHRYRLNQKYGLIPPKRTHNPPAAIVEQEFVSRADAIQALRDGRVDVIDRLYPGDALRLMKENQLTVKQYGFPTVHVLIPNLDRPYPNNWSFRKAVLFAIDREQILKEGILLKQNSNLVGCRTLSAAIPAGITDSDPLGYAYDTSISPRVRRPRVAIALKMLAISQLAKKADKNNEDPPAFKGVTIAHPATDLARTVCQMIARQLTQARMPCTLKEFRRGDSLVKDPDVDFTYAELTPWEPLVDARRMYGPSGLAPSGGTRVELALQRLDKARDWEQARNRLKDVHRMVYNDVSMIPLWQLTNYLAHRKGLTGIRPGTVWLYENVEMWKTTPHVRK